MKNNLTCEIVEDLMPSYIDGLTNEVTNSAVREHFIEPVGLLVSACAVQTSCQKRICVSVRPFALSSHIGNATFHHKSTDRNAILLLEKKRYAGAQHDEK